MAPFFLPDSPAAAKRIRIASQARPGRKTFEQFRIAPADHDVIGLQSGSEPIHNIGHTATPFFWPESLEAPKTDVILKTAALFIRQVSQLHRLGYSVYDERGPESGAQAQKEHSATFITSDGLHCGVID